MDNSLALALPVLAVAGIPALALAFGLTEFEKKFGVSGKWLTASSAFWGLVISVAFYLASGIPTDYAGWLSVIVVGVAYGLTASGVYDFLNARFPVF